MAHSNPVPHRPPLLLIGSSVRSAAASAVRAGYQPLAVDQFNDLDLLDLAPALRYRRSPRELFDSIRALPDAAWLYTGGIENDPRFIARLAGERPLWGNSSEVVRAVRDPRRLFQVLRQEGFLMPEQRDDPTGIALDGSWLVKKRRSGGGLHVRRWNEARAACHRGRGWYWQRFVPGVSIGAVYVGASQTACLIGATRALSTSHAGKSPWLYAGSVGPWIGERGVMDELARLGERLAWHFSLAGIFGVDLIVTGEQPWVLEVNPRYTAGVEVLERACDRNLIDEHVAACRDHRLAPHDGTAQRLCGKTILYAQEARTIEPTTIQRWLAWNPDRDRPQVADVPHAGTRIDPGEPIATLLVETPLASPAALSSPAMNQAALADVESILKRRSERALAIGG